ncbi:MAG: CinA family nicotinamide mononucleotide deamidase-related protein [Planctomycetota bacterium]
MNRTARIFAVGNELTEGKVVDTNSARIARALIALGFTIDGMRVLPDDTAILTAAFRQAAGTVALVVITGGLGPTVDDLTKETLAAAFDRPLAEDARAWEMILERFKSFGRAPGPNNRKQALLPAGAEPFYNTCGTAPGLGLAAGGTHFCVMPGVPREMEAMLATSLIPYAVRHLGRGPAVTERVFKTFGIGESDVGRIVEAQMARGRDPRVDVTVQEGVVTVKLAAGPAADPARIAADIEHIRTGLGAHIWTEKDESLAANVWALLRGRDFTLALAESCTGGMAAAGLVAVPGCSEVLIESVVAYANSSKRSRLGVSTETLSAQGAVSEAVVREMAEGVRRTSGASIGAAVSGIAGPGGGTDAKPVGTVWFAVAAGGYLQTHTRVLPYERDTIRSRATGILYWMIRECALKAAARRMTS